MKIFRQIYARQTRANPKGGNGARCDKEFGRLKSDGGRKAFLWGEEVVFGLHAGPRWVSEHGLISAYGFSPERRKLPVTDGQKFLDPSTAVLRCRFRGTYSKPQD